MLRDLKNFLGASLGFISGSESLNHWQIREYIFLLLQNAMYLLTDYNQAKFYNLSQLVRRKTYSQIDFTAGGNYLKLMRAKKKFS